MREDNKTSTEHTLEGQASAAPDSTKLLSLRATVASPPTGDPNPKQYLSSAGATITELTVALDSDTATFTVEEAFTGDDLDALNSFAFTLACDPPGFASIQVPDDHLAWTTPDGVAVKPHGTAPRIRHQDPGKQKLNKTTQQLRLAVTLKLHKKGLTHVLFNADITGEHRPISKAHKSKILDLNIK